MTIVGNPDAVVGGVDTHADVHVAAVVNHLGGVLGVESFTTTSHGGFACQDSVSPGRCAR